MDLLLARRRERAFARLYRRHAADVYRYAFLVLGDPEHAEGVTQATFVRAYRAHKGGERPRNAFNWLLGIAHEVCGRRSLGIDAALPEELLEDDPAPTVNDIRRALDALGYDERAALMMREVERRTYLEIATFLELSQPEVERLIFRARKVLRGTLEETLTCHRAERAISLRLDGLLDRKERRRLRAHLRLCPECERFAELQEQHRAALRSYRRAPVPARIFDRPPLLGPLARTAALTAIALLTGGVLAGSVDPRNWRHDAARIEPAEAAAQILPVTLRRARVGSYRDHRKQAKRGPRMGRLAGRQARGQAQGQERASRPR